MVGFGAAGGACDHVLAVDIKGNTEAVQSKSFLLDQTAPTVTVNIPDGAVYTQGRPVPLGAAARSLTTASSPRPTMYCMT